MERTPVKSSNVAAVGYDAVQSILEVQFTGRGVVYQYLDVPAEVAAALLVAPSVGGYLNGQVKPRYAARKVAGATV